MGHQSAAESGPLARRWAQAGWGTVLERDGKTVPRQAEGAHNCGTAFFLLHHPGTHLRHSCAPLPPDMHRPLWRGIYAPPCPRPRPRCLLAFFAAERLRITASIWRCHASARSSSIFGARRGGAGQGRTCIDVSILEKEA